MADPNYDVIPTIKPQGNLPDNYQRVQPTGFQGVAALGASLTKLGNFYDSAAIDDGFNNLQKKGTSLLYGEDVVGADGKTTRTPGYLSTEGRTAMDQRPMIQKAIDDEIANLSKNYRTPQQQQEFKRRADAYRNTFYAQTGSHADTQSNTWYASVNKATADTQLNIIASDPMNPVTLRAASADLINARIKDAQLLGAQPGDPIYTAAVLGAKQDIITAQVKAIGATDPETALDILSKNRDIAGANYDELYNSLRARADQQAGMKFVDDLMTGDTITVPATDNLDGYYAAIKRQESGGAVTAQNPNSSARGLYQFTKGTWGDLIKSHPEAGLTVDGRDDPAQQERAIRLFTKDNANYLEANGLAATPSNLYAAHFLGKAGAVPVLRTADNVPMSQAVSADVMKANPFLANMTVGQFKVWVAKAVGGQPETQSAAPQTSGLTNVGHPDNINMPPVAVPPPQDATTAAPEAPEGPAAPPPTEYTPKAQAMQQILDSDLNPEAKAHAIAYLNQQFAAQQIAADATAKQKKELSDAALNTYVTSALNGKIDGLAQQIANDNRLDANDKITATNVLMAHADSTVSGASSTYGTGFWDAYQRILAPSGDPNRIADVSTLMRMAAPGPNGETPQLTLSGVQKLQTMMAANAKDPDQASVNTAKAGLMSYAKAKLSFNGDLLIPGVSTSVAYDPKGEQIFNAQFIPKFEAAYAAAVKAGKDPWDMLNQDYVDGLIKGLRDPAEMARARMSQTMQHDTAGPIMPTPEGVNDEGWKLVAGSAPVFNGKPLDSAAWQNILVTLVSDPNPVAVKWFDQHFAAAGMSSDDVLLALGVTKSAAPKPKVGTSGGVLPPGVNPTDYPGQHAVINGVEDVGLPMPEGQ